MKQLIKKGMEKKQVIASKVSKVVGGIALTASLLCGSLSASSQDVERSDSTKQIKTEIDSTNAVDSLQEETNSKTGVLFISPTYSPNDKVGTVRVSGGGSVHALGVGGFLDLTGTPENPADVSSAFGKLNVTQSTDKIIKGTSVVITYVLNDQNPDEVYGGIKYQTKMGNGSIGCVGYPISNNGGECTLGINADQKLGDKTNISAFVLSDVKAQTYYGETEATYKVSKNISLLAQARVGGTYTSKPKVGVYGGVRIRVR